MLCRKCNGEIPEGAAFCPACGTPVSEIPEEKSSTQRYCTKCGTEIPPGENDCPKCSEETAGQETVNAQTSEAQDSPKKKVSRNKILMIVIGVVVAILLVCSETMRVFACLAGAIIFPVSLVLWIVCHVRKKPKKTWGVLMIVAVVLVLVYILFPTKCTQHEWVEATCTEPKTCSKCGETEGEALGHDWIEASCASPKTCSRCGETEGETLAHTPGEWEVVTEPTTITKGERVQTCAVCGTVLETEEIDVLPELSADEYKAQCQSYTYDAVARNPGQYNGSYAKFSGRVLQVQQSELGNTLYYTLRVATVGNYDGVLYVSYTSSKDDARILEDDNITMWGQLTGEKTYETVMGNSITIPSFSAEYIE